MAKKKLLTIEKDERGNVTKFFGFFPSDKVESEKNYITFSTCEDDDTDEIMAVKLYVHGKLVDIISWFTQFFNTTTATENEIWAFILGQCRKHTRAPKIFIDRNYVENFYSPLASSVRKDILSV